MIKKIIITISLAAIAFASPTIVMETTQGTIELELHDKKAPIAVKNFTELVKSGYYNGLTFHRIIPNFMIQGGDPTGTGSGGESIWKKDFKDEFYTGDTFNKPGILAMANSGPNTNGSQFFITVKATSWLNNKHTIFGHVSKGYGTIKKLEEVRTRNTRPITTQKILKAYIRE